ncbi:hypothetical protein D9M71_499000 [compost metagenome]
MADRRPRLGPGPVEQAQQAVMKHIEKALAGAVGVVALALAHVLGQVQGQGAVGAAEAKEELLQARRALLCGRRQRCQGCRRKSAIELLAKANRLIGQAQGMAEAWQLRRLALKPAQGLEEIVVPGFGLHLAEDVHRVGRRPGLAFHRMISPRSVVRSTVSVKLLIDT